MSTRYLIASVIFFWSVVGQYAYGQKMTREKVETLYDQTWEWLDEDLDSAMKYAELQKAMAMDIDYELGLIKAYYVIGYINYLQKYLDVAALNYFTGLTLASKETSREYKTRKMLILQNLAKVYEDAYQKDDAISYSLDALELAKELDRKDNITQLYFNLGVFYEKKEDYQKALEWYQKAENHVAQFPDDNMLSKIKNYTGNVYNKTARYDKAKENYLAALKITDTNEELKDRRVYYVSNLGENALKRGNTAEAIAYYNQALDLAVAFKDIDKIKLVSNNLGDAYLKEGKLTTAIGYYDAVLAYSPEADIIDREYQRASQHISEAYELLGDYKNALAYRKVFLAQADVLQSTKDKLTEQNSQYRMKEVEWMLERQAQQAQLMAMQTENFWFKFSISILLIVFAYSAYKAIRYYRGIRAVKKLVLAD